MGLVASDLTSRTTPLPHTPHPHPATETHASPGSVGSTTFILGTAREPTPPKSVRWKQWHTRKPPSTPSAMHPRPSHAPNPWSQYWQVSTAAAAAAAAASPPATAAADPLLAAEVLRAATAAAAAAETLGDGAGAGAGAARSGMRMRMGSARPATSTPRERLATPAPVSAAGDSKGLTAIPAAPRAQRRSRPRPRAWRVWDAFLRRGAAG